MIGINVFLVIFIPRNEQELASNRVRTSPQLDTNNQKKKEKRTEERKMIEEEFQLEILKRIKENDPTFEEADFRGFCKIVITQLIPKHLTKSFILLNKQTQMQKNWNCLLVQISN